METIAVNLCVAGKKTAHAVFGDVGAGVSSFLTDNFAPPTSVDWQVRGCGDAAPEVQAVCFENGC